jgi:hypothetical protein
VFSTGLVLVAGSVYYGGATGILTTTPFSPGVSQRIGIATSTSDFMVDLGTPILKQ